MSIAALGAASLTYSSNLLVPTLSLSPSRYGEATQFNLISATMPSPKAPSDQPPQPTDGDAMSNDQTKKKAGWVYSDDFELDVAVYMLPSLWWSAAMYGRSLSRAYTTLGRRDGATVSAVAMTFYRHFLGSMLGMAFELALKGLLISLDDPPTHRVGFPKRHDLPRLWELVPETVQAEIEGESKAHGFQRSFAEWFNKHAAFLSVEDRYPQKRAGDSLKWQTTSLLLVPRAMSNDLIGQMEVVFDCIVRAMKRRYFSDEQAEMPVDELDELRGDMDKFEGLQHTRNRWSHLWGTPVVRPPNGTPSAAESFLGGEVVGYQLDVTMLEQGQEASPRTVPRLWWIPVDTNGLREFTDAEEFNSFVRRQIEGAAG